MPVEVAVEEPWVTWGAVVEAQYAGGIQVSGTSDSCPHTGRHLRETQGESEG